MDMDLRIEGADELEAKLQLLGEKFGNAALFGALLDAAKPIADEIKKTAPIAQSPYFRYLKNKRGGDTVKRQVQGGTLRKSVTRKRVKKLEFAAVTVSIKDRAFYWTFIENGTPRKAAQPFMRPAFDRKQAEASAIFADKLRKRIEKIAAKQNIDLGAEDGEG